MSQIAFIDLAFLVEKHGFPAGESQATAIAIITCESDRDPAFDNLVSAPGQPQDGSHDRGVWAFNSYFHPEVADACAFDPDCSTDAAFKLSKSGTDFTSWGCFTSGEYENHLEAARVALDAKQRLEHVNAELATDQATIDTLHTQVATQQTQIQTLQAQVDADSAKIAAAQKDLS